MSGARRRPNVLWIFADQLRYQALGSSGDPNAITPNLDRLAEQGVRCTQAVSNYPVCTPFRASLMTARHATACGTPRHGDLLPPGTDTAAHAFRRAGYRTSYVGKWHLAGERGAHTVSEAGWAGEDFWVHPTLRGGFEDWFGFNVSNHYYRTFYCRGERVEPHRLEGYMTDALTDLTLDYLSSYDRPEPWFHVIAYESPHPGRGGTPRSPLYPVPERFEQMILPDALALRANVPPERDAEAREQLAGYYALIANLDENVGRLLAALDDAGLADDTLVLFFSDHGEMGESHGLRNKQVPYDESVRIPLLLRWPGVLEEGRVYDTPVSGLDIYPSTAGLCAVPGPVDRHGVDHSEALLGGGSGPRSSVLIQWETPRFAFGDHPYRAIRDDRHTYVVGRDRAFCLLFDNERDPYQLDNGFFDPERRALRRRLHARLLRALHRVGEPAPDYVERWDEIAEGGAAPP